MPITGSCQAAWVHKEYTRPRPCKHCKPTGTHFPGLMYDTCPYALEQAPSCLGTHAPGAWGQAAWHSELSSSPTAHRMHTVVLLERERETGCTHMC